MLDFTSSISFWIAAAYHHHWIIFYLKPESFKSRIFIRTHTHTWLFCCCSVCCCCNILFFFLNGRHSIFDRLMFLARFPSHFTRRERWRRLLAFGHFLQSTLYVCVYPVYNVVNRLAFSLHYYYYCCYYFESLFHSLLQRSILFSFFKSYQFLLFVLLLFSSPIRHPLSPCLLLSPNEKKKSENLLSFDSP